MASKQKIAVPKLTLSELSAEENRKLNRVVEQIVLTQLGATKRKRPELYENPTIRIKAFDARQNKAVNQAIGKIIGDELSQIDQTEFVSLKIPKKISQKVTAKVTDVVVTTVATIIKNKIKD